MAVECTVKKIAVVIVGHFSLNVKRLLKKIFLKIKFLCDWTVCIVKLNILSKISFKNYSNEKVNTFQKKFVEFRRLAEKEKNGWHD